VHTNPGQPVAQADVMDEANREIGWGWRVKKPLRA